MPKSAYPKHAATLAWAEEQIGQHEVPMGSNSGPFVILCQRATTWLRGTGWAWCRVFSLRAHLEGGFTLPDESAGAWDALDRAQKRGDALSPQAGRTHAIPGDEVIWAFGSGHCSILKAFTVIGGETYVISIDGNVGDRVEQCQRPLSEVKGFIHWQEKPMINRSLTPAPRAQVVGSISGTRKLVTAKGRVLPLPAKKAGPAGVVKITKPNPKPKAAGKSPAHTGARAKVTPKKTTAKPTTRKPSRSPKRAS